MKDCLSRSGLASLVPSGGYRAAIEDVSRTPDCSLARTHQFHDRPLVPVFGGALRRYSSPTPQ